MKINSKNNSVRCVSDEDAILDAATWSFRYDKAVKLLHPTVGSFKDLPEPEKEKYLQEARVLVRHEPLSIKDYKERGVE